MTAAPIGAIVRLYLDDPVQPVEKGHVIQTGTGRLYRVVSARRSTVTGRNGAVRWYMTVRVVPRGTILADDVVHTLRWYARPPRRPSRRERLRMLHDDRLGPGAVGGPGQAR